ncbi:plant self-incompatibility protein S1 family [Striga asiatica]|uniref:S-protein homolog n=1 Tax=Striga asiatica TaxID=4170 RepID=A0A5A7PP59_STRAF|nr:plant self-incompatibility protein S1 family [Striga asiatica]
MKEVVSLMLYLLTTSSLIDTSQGTLPLQKSRVIVTNQIPIYNETSSIECYSSDDNLGVHNLSYRASYQWSFKTSLFNTKFYCYFRTSCGEGKYGVFTNRINDLYCNYVCNWSIYPNGLTVDNHRFPGSMVYWQSWKTRKNCNH